MQMVNSESTNSMRFNFIVNPLDVKTGSVGGRAGVRPSTCSAHFSTRSARGLLQQLSFDSVQKTVSPCRS